MLIADIRSAELVFLGTRKDSGVMAMPHQCVAPVGVRFSLAATFGLARPVRRGRARVPERVLCEGDVRGVCQTTSLRPAANIAIARERERWPGFS